VHWDFDLPWFPGLFFPFGLVSLALYFLPTIIVLARRKKNVLGPILVNILLGWNCHRLDRRTDLGPHCRRLDWSTSRLPY
jgi:hypothetical protein